MQIKKYEEMNPMALDLMKEVGSIGTGNAATALSQVLSKEVHMSIPEISILGYNETIKKLGNPEEIVAAVLVRMSGEMEGMMLFILKLDFINTVLEHLLDRKVESYDKLSVMEISALEEIGNIIISSYMNALSSLTNREINLSVPDTAVNMLGGILSVPMVEFGYSSDKLMMTEGKFYVDGKELQSHLLMMPSIDSLNYLMELLYANH
ncbi:chemotaxis protein CheC [Lachnospiraceae bacterium LCP25S3_G4]